MWSRCRGLASIWGDGDGIPRPGDRPLSAAPDAEFRFDTGAEADPGPFAALAKLRNKV